MRKKGAKKRYEELQAKLDEERLYQTELRRRELESRLRAQTPIFRFRGGDVVYNETIDPNTVFMMDGTPVAVPVPEEDRNDVIRARLDELERRHTANYSNRLGVAPPLSREAIDRAVRDLSHQRLRDLLRRVGAVPEVNSAAWTLPNGIRVNADVLEEHPDPYEYIQTLLERQPPIVHSESLPHSAQTTYTVPRDAAVSIDFLDGTTPVRRLFIGNFRRGERIVSYFDRIEAGATQPGERVVFAIDERFQNLTRQIWLAPARFETGRWTAQAERNVSKPRIRETTKIADVPQIRKIRR